MRGQLKPLSQNYLKPNNGESGEVLLYVLIYALIFKRSFIAQMLSALQASFHLLCPRSAVHSFTVHWVLQSLSKLQRQRLRVPWLHKRAL